MPLEHTFVQTHRHYVSEHLNVVSVEEARANHYPLVAECGRVWIPGSADETAALPMCDRCDVNSSRATRSPRDDHPHYVYRHYDTAGALLYVGCTVAPKSRMLGHQQNSWWYSQSAAVRMTIFPSLLHARRIERDAIRTERPLWNVRHQDFNSWPREQLRLGRDLAHAEEAPDQVIKRFRKWAGVA